MFFNTLFILLNHLQASMQKKQLEKCENIYL